MTDRSTGPRCGNNPNTRLTPGDPKAVDDAKARLALQAAAKPYIERAAWVDFDPLMEVIASTVWKHCGRDDEDMPQLVCDDPRTIAAFATAVARAHAAAVPAPATDQADRPINDMRELYAVQHAITDAGGTLTPAVHQAIDALRETWDRGLRRAQAAFTDRAAVLTAAERTMLTYALDQAQEKIWSEDGFTDEDQAAVTSLRRMADETQPPEPVADDYEQTTGHLITCFTVAGGNPDPDCPCADAPAAWQQPKGA